MVERTQVGIVGAGPAGLLLSHLLHLEGIESVVLEDRSRAYVQHRVRAGVLEQGTVELLDAAGVGERVHREGLVHEGINVQFEGQRHRIPLAELTGGRTITIYGQQELVKDLTNARLEADGVIHFEVADVAVEGIGSAAPLIRYDLDGQEHELRCDVVAGCDGAHGVSRGAIPAGVLTTYHHDHPYAWLGILASVAPSTDELIYARHPHGFALHSLRSPSVSRLYVQVDPGEDIAAWPDERIWDELAIRLGLPGWTLTAGPITEKSITALSSTVIEPMQHGRLFLAGDAAHIVPATGAKGLNLAVADVRVLARALAVWFRSGATADLEGYSARCLRRVWRVQDFSATMSGMLHNDPTGDAFLARRQAAQLHYLVTSEAASRSLAENYVGLPFDDGASFRPVDGPLDTPTTPGQSRDRDQGRPTSPPQGG
ncbi:MAG: 4-hydroxybenzoate 3-monooxygenase [Candidatus Limnocylindrales bacterium]